MNVYEIVTEQVVKALEQGTAPWKQPWSSANAPRNMDGRKYSGVNVFLLEISRGAQGFTSPYWVTYKKAQALGGSVRKGEKSTLVVFWKQLKFKDENARPGEVSSKDKTIPMLRYYRVFNLEQTEGIDAPVSDDIETHEHLDNVTAEDVMAGYLANGGPTLSENGDSALYRPSTDHVTLPPRETFVSSDLFYSAAFHELGHSTGNVTRLNRKYERNTGFGSHGYGREELVAEMTSAFLGAEAGLTDTLPVSASYLASWIRTIKEDTRAVVVAAGAAQKAADLILGRVKVKQEQTALAA